MLSVNEAACIVPGAMKRRHGLQTELLEGSSSSAAALAFLPPCNRKRRSHARVQLPGSEEKGGEGCTGRHSQEVACLFTVISASAALSYSLIYTYLTAL